MFVCLRITIHEFRKEKALRVKQLGIMNSLKFLMDEHEKFFTTTIKKTNKT